MKEFFSKLLEASLKVWGFVWGLFTMAILFFDWILEEVQGVVAHLVNIEELAAGFMDAQAFTTVAVAWDIGNALAPLEEGAAMMVSFLVFWGVVLAVRWVKSFIPTVAN